MDVLESAQERPLLSGCLGKVSRSVSTVRTRLLEFFELDLFRGPRPVLTGEGFCVEVVELKVERTQVI